MNIPHTFGDNMIRLLVIYDIKGSNKYNKLYKYLKSIGSHIQNSVFEIEANENEISNISQSISKYANIDTDSIIIYNLGNTKKVSKIEIGKMRYLSILDSRYLII